MTEAVGSLDALLDRMWRDYTSMNPQARRIHALFAEKGEDVLNDHVALRTFDLARVNIEVLARPFLRWGYRHAGSYEFPAKKLVARHFEHEDPRRPKIFISQVLTRALPEGAQRAIAALVAQVPDTALDRADFCAIGRPWQLSFETYRLLRESSEYAAWVAAFGYRANHFTVLVNTLKCFASIEAVNAFLEQAGYVLNDAGGKVKGSPEALLEQSSVLANNLPVTFTDGEHWVPGCYYEFAKRYAMPSGGLYQGFIAASADRIFESTDRGQ